MISVDALDLGFVRLPEWHPRASGGTCPIQGLAVRHPDGVIVFDTGVGDDSERIDEIYHPSVVPVVTALNDVGVDERDVTAIVNSHLHFDHCGQNRSLLSATVWAQAVEYTLIDVPRFTIAEWARTDPVRLRLIDGDEQLADGVRIVATPGHTPGHQSLVVESGGITTLLAGQPCSSCAEYADRMVDPADVHDESWLDVADESLARLHALEPDIVHLAHDHHVHRRVTS